MLGKTIPYAEIWRYHPQNISITEPSLPEGFHFEFYQLGGELEWATIETSVLEFEPDKDSLIRYFGIQQQQVKVLAEMSTDLGACSLPA